MEWKNVFFVNGSLEDVYLLEGLCLKEALMMPSNSASVDRSLDLEQSKCLWVKNTRLDGRYISWLLQGFRLVSVNGAPRSVLPD